MDNYWFPSDSWRFFVLLEALDTANSWDLF